jgi:hypothetical protein
MDVRHDLYLAIGVCYTGQPRWCMTSKRWLRWCLVLSRRALYFSTFETSNLSILAWQFCIVVQTTLAVAFLNRLGAPSSTVEEQRVVCWWRDASQRRLICYWRTVTMLALLERSSTGGKTSRERDVDSV